MARKRLDGGDLGPVGQDGPVVGCRSQVGRQKESKCVSRAAATRAGSSLIGRCGPAACRPGAPRSAEPSGRRLSSVAESLDSDNALDRTLVVEPNLRSAQPGVFRDLNVSTRAPPPGPGRRLPMLQGCALTGGRDFRYERICLICADCSLSMVMARSRSFGCSPRCWACPAISTATW